MIIIGSAKLGFSLKTDNFLPFDHKYVQTKNTHDRSDIDIALVNNKYFDEVAETIYHLSQHFDKEWRRKNWTTNQYYVEGKALFVDYSQYVTRGWLRPDYMPNSYLREAAWFDPSSSWGSKLGRRVSVGVYSNWTYLKHYHMDNLIRLRAKLSTLEVI